MIRGSLRLRLLAAAAVAIALALGLAGAAMGWIFQRHIEQREADALIRDARLLAGGLRLDGAGRPATDAQPGDDRYAEPGSGRYWQLSTAAGAAHSQSLWDQNLPPGRASADTWRVRHAPGPFGKSLLLVERQIRTSGAATPVLIQVGTDDAPLGVAQREFGRETALSLGLLWVFLLAATYAQVTLGLRPLSAVGRQLVALRRNPSARLTTDHPKEIAPLAEAINALADAREADLARARRRAGDLAHSLKTPLAALAAQSRRAREAGASEAADGLDRAIEAMRASLETELARARAAAAREAGQGPTAQVAALIEAIISVVERTEHGERLVFETDVPPDAEAPVAAEDLTEILGALIENAARHARRRVRVRVDEEAGAPGLVIEDDGQGIGREAVEAVLVRGGRLDEAGPGHGLGLAIVHDLMQASGGTIALGRGPLGGLEVRLAWPAQDAR